MLEEIVKEVQDKSPYELLVITPKDLFKNFYFIGENHQILYPVVVGLSFEDKGISRRDGENIMRIFSNECDGGFAYNDKTYNIIEPNSIESLVSRILNSIENAYNFRKITLNKLFHEPYIKLKE